MYPHPVMFEGVTYPCAETAFQAAKCADVAKRAAFESLNGFNARTEHINVFEHIGRNKSFIAVMLAIFAMQAIFVSFGGQFLGVTPLSALNWLVCIGLSIMVIPIDMIRKAITKAITKPKAKS